MRSWGLFWKLFAAFALLSLGITVAFGALALPNLVHDEEAQVERGLEAGAELLAQWARPVLRGEGAAEDLQARFARLGPEAPTRFTVIGADGRVLADTHHDPATMDDHSGRPEVVGARETGRGSSVRFSNTLRTRLMYVALRVEADGKVLGFARTAHSLGAIDARKDRLRRIVLGAAAGALLVGLGLAYFVTRRIVRPLQDLTRAATALAQGEHDIRVPVHGRDELARLGEAFNRMSAELRARIETIRRDRTELLAMLSAMAEGVLATDDQERVVLINEAAGRLLGVSPEAASGRRVWEVTRLTPVREVLSRALETGQTQEREATLPASPRDRHLQLLAAPVRVPGSEATGAVLVLHDISELRYLEKVRQDFVANVSHELKTPLSAIRGFAETILEDPEMDAETRAHFLARVRGQAVRLGDLVEEVLALSRLEAAQDAIPLAPVDVVASVREATQSLQALAKERQIELATDLPSRDVIVRGDAEGLRRVASNLLDNALKYTPRGGAVTVGLTEEDRHVRLVVEDTGIGIPAEARERVFERFYRVDPGRSRAAGGTGLGLSIVKHLVNGMGGRVWVEEAAEGGSRFTVLLPRPGASRDRPSTTRDAQVTPPRPPTGS